MIRLKEHVYYASHVPSASDVQKLVDRSSKIRDSLVKMVDEIEHAAREGRTYYGFDVHDESSVKNIPLEIVKSVFEFKGYSVGYTNGSQLIISWAGDGEKDNG